MTGSHRFTTRTDRLVSLLSFVVSVLIVLAIAGIFFGLLGPVELVIALVIAIPMTIVLSRWLRTVVERRNHPA
jgi:putative flippase GtrA